ncbi:hypothetical protein CTA1_5444 [Colletotrichum tanaceti]|uniref:Uncharacterized protein n=1 Tax=Colletotrichum tanaceti TaxID=1306861 RepID=A0A4U6XFA4_9PEZI|nr:hypothetical protein CTA1_5444 [Colletotrichum tanaceti]
MLGTRLGRRQREGEEKKEDDGDDDSDDDNDEEGAAAMRACVCGARGLDVAGAAFGCAACVACNTTAVEANEDIRQIIAECGFVAAPAPPVLVTTMTTAAAPVSPTITLPPPALAPGEPSTASSSTPTSTMTTPPPATQTPSVPTTPSQPAEASWTQRVEPVTPITVFETPTFAKVPPIVPPNDAPATPPDLSDGNQMSDGAKRRVDVLGWGVVSAAVVVFLLS